MKLIGTITTALLAIFIISGCGDDAPTEPQSENGYVANGEGYTNDEVSASSSVAIMLSSSSTITMTGTLKGEPATLNVVVNGKVPGDYTWTGNNSVFVKLDVGAVGNVRTYIGKNGKTVLSTVGNPGGRTTGTFSGTMSLLSDDTRKFEVNGKFNAVIQ